ncbi:TetR/AcrR family transcriptional regulator [Nocardiopsis alborubida]|uniref:TetR/AcrR family transcriptional regulator n=1 Tax=Nocardiopsis alborubida TaxID=146802 RepID=A0A7X6MGX8_9ACTN|nr:TetR/AcrR family transcriptional regulator [Nocardiopsis alborubida]NKZ01122.1 TetR/AcrR family transcriptional regulator [Nocardiopsis alborubida]
MRRTEVTRALLLNAARREFANHGIAGARVDRIAERAGVNKQRIYAYFGDKEQLFRHVVTGALDELSTVVELRGTEPSEYVRRVHEFHRDHPDLLRLLLWESLHYGDRPLPDEDERTALYTHKADDLAEVMGEEVSRHTRLLLLTLIGVAAWPNIVQQLSRMVLGRDLRAPEAQKELTDFLVSFVRSAVESGQGTGGTHSGEHTL